MMIDTIKLIALCEAEWPGWLTGAPESAAAQNVRELARKLHEDPLMTDVRWRAYALATVRTECGQDFQVRSEAGGTAYLNRYEPSTALGRALGNTQAGDGVRFKGRGYVQLTGRANYAKFSQLCGVDLIGNPDAALSPDVAYQVMSEGMRRGLFTGHSLARWIHEDVCDYRNARRIINGIDKADSIAADAVKFEKCLRGCEA